MNELEFFLLKLHLCNLDLKNELRVVRYMLSFERCPSKDELFLLLKLGQTQKNDLWNALQSKQLSQKIQQNLKVSHFLTILDKRYPSQLQEIYSPPVVLFYKSAKEQEDHAFKYMWLTIVLSFGFYIPVVLWADTIPMIGMLMIPKTCAYVWTVLIGYFAMIHEKRICTEK